MSRLIRSLIFVPGNNTRFINKAKNLNADIICLDLEDSVPASEKDKARELVREELSDKFMNEVYVRINAPNTQYIEDDIKCIVRQGLSGIVIPKVNSANEIRKIEELIKSLEEKEGLREGSIELIPSIENAIGVVNAYNIASSSERVTAVIFGIFDLLHDLGVEYDENDFISYIYPRAKVALDAKAANVYAIDSIWQKIDDREGLIRDAKFGMKLGYNGKSIIHPNQIDVVHDIFKPSKEEIEWAKRIVNALEEAKRAGKGAIRLEGKMIDEVHYKRAKALLSSISS
ncbi:MAG: CoA ester lyase [Candidatus Nitrosocaldaceae archaeon]